MAGRRWLGRPWWVPLVAALVALFTTQNPTLGRLDLLAYDWPAPSQPSRSDLVLVVIEEASIARLGQWPWPRRLLAQMVDRLAAADASATAHAVLFSDPQTGAVRDARASDMALADVAHPGTLPEVLPGRRRPTASVGRRRLATRPRSVAAAYAA